MDLLDLCCVVCGWEVRSTVAVCKDCLTKNNIYDGNGHGHFSRKLFNMLKHNGKWDEEHVVEQVALKAQHKAGVQAFLHAWKGKERQSWFEGKTDDQLLLIMKSNREEAMSLRETGEHLYLKRKRAENARLVMSLLMEANKAEAVQYWRRTHPDIPLPKTLELFCWYGFPVGQVNVKAVANKVYIELNYLDSEVFWETDWETCPDGSSFGLWFYDRKMFG